MVREKKCILVWGGGERRVGQRVFSVLRRVPPLLYANKEAGFVWDKSQFLCFLIQMSVNLFFVQVTGSFIS